MIVLKCAYCKGEYPADSLINLCECGRPLLVRYDPDRVKLRKEDLASRGRDMWRYRELLPARRDPVTLGEGFTPIVPLRRLGSMWDIENLFMKDEGLNPTGTFKARGAAMGITMARDLGARTVALATAGNAGGAWAAYGARAGLRVVVAMPADAPEMAKRECVAYGARVFLVSGLISNAGKVVSQAARERGWFEVSTLKEPYRIEGKKTMGLEIAEQFHWDLPEVILYPTGGGVGLIGMWKAFDELEALNWIGKRRPRFVAVQAEGCAPIVQAFADGKEESNFWEGASTIAGGIRVPKSLGDFLVLRALRETGGTAVTVSDPEILSALQEAARAEGALLCPEGAAALAAARKLREAGFIAPHERVLVVNTGSGLKYPELLRVDPSVLEGERRIP